jgi:2-hydroxy-6-oxonona-2,4-dienedioate hydrolase|tara:strand:- start:709 stop:1476 length:768 start_codon:yes stop_codon:yes gene_type:complete
MNFTPKEENKFKYIEKGDGTPIIFLHGLMGGLTNFEKLISFFSENNFKVLVPELPLYDLPLLNTSVKAFAEYLNDFIKFKELDKFILLGNSLGGHVGLYYTKLYEKKAAALVLTGSSGLYESAMGSGYTRRGDYDVMKAKVEEVFYDPKVATKELVDEVFETVNDRRKLVKTLAIAKSAIRHNMSDDLPQMNLPVCIIWGEDDIVTPPDVADEFHKLLPDSDLFWIKKCGHAAMMEHPDKFNKIVINWLSDRKII